MAYFTPRNYNVCERCGVPILFVDLTQHECNPERVVEQQVFKLRPEIQQFDLEFGAWLETPHGRFARYYAERSHA